MGLLPFRHAELRGPWQAWLRVRDSNRPKRSDNKRCVVVWESHIRTRRKGRVCMMLLARGSTGDEFRGLEMAAAN